MYCELFVAIWRFTLYTYSYKVVSKQYLLLLKLDLQWWLDFLPTWSGKSLILQTNWLPNSAMQLYTNASGLHGWGTY